MDSKRSLFVVCSLLFIGFLAALPFLLDGQLGFVTNWLHPQDNTGKTLTNPEPLTDPSGEGEGFAATLEEKPSAIEPLASPEPPGLLDQVRAFPLSFKIAVGTIASILLITLIVMIVLFAVKAAQAAQLQSQATDLELQLAEARRASSNPSLASSSNTAFLVRAIMIPMMIAIGIALYVLHEFHGKWAWAGGTLLLLVFMIISGVLAGWSGSVGVFIALIAGLALSGAVKPGWDAAKPIQEVKDKLTSFAAKIDPSALGIGFVVLVSAIGLIFA